jgi:hypothetical protein
MPRISSPDGRAHLMVDDFAGYKALFADGVTELGCLTHARRKFFDLNAAQANPIALEALNRIAALYAIEDQGKDIDIVGRTQFRQAQAQPLLQSMHDWLGRNSDDGGQWRGHRQGDRLQSQTLGGPESVCRTRAFADRQQSGGEHYPADRNRKKELAIYRIVARRKTGRRDSEFARHRKAQWTRSRRVVARNPGEATLLPQQPDRFAVAVPRGSSTPLLFVSECGRVERLQNTGVSDRCECSA